MPITYDVFLNGHFIHGVAEGILTSEEFVAYEVAHAIDKRVKAPLRELLTFPYGAARHLRESDVSEVLNKRKSIDDLPTPHKCAMVVSYLDHHTWNLARYYEWMVALHYPKNVIVFGDVRTARVWLGVGDVSPEEQAFLDHARPAGPHGV